VPRRNPEYDEDAYRRALDGDKNLEGANLEGANLKGANLLLANLAGSNLAHTNLEDASLLAANLASARLAGANLASASLAGAKFTGADLTGANLKDAHLVRADLSGANLRGANLASASLAGANLRDANLEGANLEGTYLDDADLFRAYLEEANLEGADLKGANLLRANLEYANLRGANLRRANLAGSNLRGANLLRADLFGANLAGANLEGANLEGANLSEANLTGANLRGANLEDANLSEANLTGANLRGANLEDANLSEANLTGADLEGVNVEAAYWDRTPRWPAGFLPPVLREHLTLSDPSGSEAFRRWFGDSVVTDETGRPVVVYHGTRSGGFKVFDPAKADAHHPGFYFTDDILTANTYVGKKTTLPDPVSGATEGAYRLYIKMERPFIHDAKGGQWNDLHIPQFPNKRKTYEAARAVRETGLYDGVIFKNLRDSGGQSDYDEPADVYVVFDPKNIKSATANVGTYDPNDPDIRHNPRRSFSPRPSRGARSTRKPKGRR
jgi:uncharacterized protein YjbI with pentapeptide repeats